MICSKPGCPNERVLGQRWCKPCRAQASKDRRAAVRQAPAPGSLLDRLGVIEVAAVHDDMTANTMNVPSCPRCARTAGEVRAAFEGFMRAADPGLLGRLKWGAFRERVLAALGEREP